VPCHLIPVNSVQGSPFRKSSPETTLQFVRTLTAEGVTATVRRTLGADIDASCGQLRRRYEEEAANVKVFSQSDVGLIRKSNEDACRCGILSSHAAWAVVCDGMGGVNGGNVASNIAVQKISETILSGYRVDMGGDATRELIASAINQANEAVHELAEAT